jgi:hypothetical protein
MRRLVHGINIFCNGVAELLRPHPEVPAAERRASKNG